MLSIDVIKKHLRSTMKPYAIIIPGNNGFNFAASVYKDNSIISFNEDEIFKGINQYSLINDKYIELREKDFTFILNMYFLHENSSHNKERIINFKKESPIIFLDENLNQGIILSDIDSDSGEAGIFTEQFIANRDIILGLVNCKNSLGALLKVEYFNDKNFNKLIDKYNSIIKDKEKETEENIEEKKLYSSFVGGKKNMKTKYYFDNVKRNRFGLTARDNYLFQEAKKDKSNY